ncbi:MAG TPA: transcription termination/antitermination NusG family protein [Candidatus Binatia bacterium]|jgi:transcription elongation factor/antiterminator RfaH
MAIMEANRWYVVYSKPQKEEFAEFCLKHRGVEVFLPKLLFPESLKKRKRIVPLFPSYLFTRISDADQYQCVLWTPGVKRIVSFNGTPMPLDDSVISFLKREGGTDGVIAARSDLKTGQEVYISGGPFEGLMGIIQEPPSANGRVKVLMRLLSRQVKVEVPLQFVNCSWVTDSSKSKTVDLESCIPQAHA